MPIRSNKPINLGSPPSLRRRRARRWRPRSQCNRIALVQVEFTEKYILTRGHVIQSDIQQDPDLALHTKNFGQKIYILKYLVYDSKFGRQKCYERPQLHTLLQKFLSQNQQIRSKVKQISDFFRWDWAIKSKYIFTNNHWNNAGWNGCNDLK